MSDEKSKPVRGGHRQPQHENEGDLNPEDNDSPPEGVETSSESPSTDPLSEPESEDHQKRGADELSGPVAGCSGKNPHQSPQPSTSASGDNLPPEGAVGGQVLEDPDADLRSRCALFDGKVYPGKVYLMRKVFGEKVLINAKPDENLTRTRHNATRYQGRIPIPSQFSSENPLGHLQTPDPEQGPLLNQAGAIVGNGSHQRNGNCVASGNNGQLAGFGSGSAVTRPVGEINTSGGYTPPVTCSDTSSRGTSSSLPQSSSESYDRGASLVQLPDFQETFGNIAMAARRRLKIPSDSGNRQKAEQPRPVGRKRPAEKKPATIPSGESEFAGFEGSYSEEKRPLRDHDYIAPPQLPAPDSDKDGNSTDETASEDTETYSIGNEFVQPVPDPVQDVPPPLVNEANPPGPPCEQEPVGESSNEEDTAMDVSASGVSKNGEKRQSDEN